MVSIHGNNTVLHTSISDETGARFFIEHLVNKGCEYHLEENPFDILSGQTGEPLFTCYEATLVSRRMKEIYALPQWSADHCPISVMMELIEARDGETT